MNKNALYVVLILGLGGYYGYDTFYPEYVGWESEIAELQANLDQARRTAPRLADLTQEEIELQQRLAASLEKLPSGAELDNLLAMVTPILEGVGIQSTQIGQKNVDQASEQDIYRTHPIRLTDIRGLSMRQIVKLLFDLRNFYRIVNVKSYSINRTGPDQYTLNLDLETYSYIAAEGEELPPPSTPPAEAAPQSVETPTDTAAAAPPSVETVDTASSAPSAAGGTDTAAAAGDTSSEGGDR